MWNLRAWDERKKIMHYDFQFIRSGETGSDWIIFASEKHTLDASVKDPGKHHPFDDPYFAQQLKIMRGVGLYDFRGHEIYEQDIIKDSNDRRLTVVYDDAQWWVVNEEMNLKSGLDARAIRRYEYEVVGNVYETPATV